MSEKEKNITEELENEKTNEETKETSLHPNEEYEELNDRYKRVLAEFENFKKRSLKEREGLYNSVLSDIILGILPAIDNLDNAVTAQCLDENYKQGVELVQKQFQEFLAKNNVEEIEAEGVQFDPAMHEAISSVQVEGKESQEVIQVYRKGYKIGSKVIRHSMVVVNQ